MLLNLLRTKIHRAMVTEANLHYEGSITIDSALMEAAGILPHEQVHICNIDNGNRFVTYVIEGPAESGAICINGAAARLASPGDRVIIIAYGQMTIDEAKTFRPRVVLVDDKNHVKDRHELQPGTIRKPGQSLKT
jgi:aspartate 1-decarboxylase